jgi:hypothetical protein
MTDTQAVVLSSFFTKAIRDQLARKGLSVHRTGYDRRTSPTVSATTHEDGVVEVQHLKSYDIGRWEIHGDYEAIPQSYFNEHKPCTEGDGIDTPVIYYYEADKTRTYSSVAGALLLAVQ